MVYVVGKESGFVQTMIDAGKCTTSIIKFNVQVDI